ncbi:MAG TPA: menaquinone biosynthesis protein [Bryobacteraceae bacterium]|nr:menaquinone biosynthesis protein [Bryobacteraceae bacterium]
MLGKPRVCAVSYLNTSPLVWGMLYGPQQGVADVSFAVPSVCAQRVVEGVAEVGLLPVIEIERHGFSSVPEAGIACRGPVRSILLVSRTPFDRIRTLATDLGSRTSVQLARIILQRKYGAEPRVFPAEPDLVRMLEYADAALLIGDSALRVDPAQLEWPCLDLGEEWTTLTGLPMVFALWAGRRSAIREELVNLIQGSCHFGLAQLDQIIPLEAERRGFSEALVHEYLTRNINFQIGPEEQAGLAAYLSYACQLDHSQDESCVPSEIPDHDDDAGSR